MNSPDPCRRRRTNGGLRESVARAGCDRDHDDVRQCIERHRDQAERDELQRRMTGGRIDELRNERQEKRRSLRIERLDHDAVAERLLDAERRDRPGLRNARFAKRLEAEPDQIKRAGEFQDGKEFGAGQDDRGDAEPARDHMHEAAGRIPERGGDAGLAAAGQRSRRDIEDAGAGHRRDDKRGEQE